MNNNAYIVKNTIQIESRIPLRYDNDILRFDDDVPIFLNGYFEKDSEYVFRLVFPKKILYDSCDNVFDNFCKSYSIKIKIIDILDRCKQLGFIISINRLEEFHNGFVSLSCVFIPCNTICNPVLFLKGKLLKKKCLNIDNIKLESIKVFFIK